MEPQISSRASKGRRHVCSAGIRGFPLPKGNRDADERGLANPVLNTLRSSQANIELNPASIEFSGLNYPMVDKT